MTSEVEDDQGGLEQVSHADRVASLTGVRAVAALTVMGTHAAYGTGLLSQGYVGLMSARLEVGVAIFFVLSGLPLFGPWVRAAAADSDAPSVRRYARNRFRRIMPAYVVTVLLVYGIYELRPVQPNPGHTWTGLLRNLTLTQIYSDNYFTEYLHQGLSQMWSLAVEVAFYAVLPLLAYLLLVVLCRRQFRPVLLLVGLTGLAAISPLWLVLLHNTDWLPVGGGAWLPHYLVWFVGGMVLAVLGEMGVAVMRWRRCRWPSPATWWSRHRSRALPTKYGQFASDAGPALDAAANADKNLSDNLRDSANTDRNGRQTSGSVVNGAASDTNALQPASRTAAGQRAMISALRERLAQ